MLIPTLSALRARHRILLQSLGFFIALLSLLSLAACSGGADPHETRLVVLVSATPELAPELDRIEISTEGATKADKVSWLRNAPAGEKVLPLPLKFVVAPDTRDSGTLAIRAYSGTTLRAQRLAKVAFRPGRTLLFSVLLGGDCVDAACSKGTTCGDCGECSPLQVDLDTLIEIDDTENALDAWKAPRCDSKLADGGMDASDGQGARPDGSLADGAMSDGMIAMDGMTVMMPDGGPGAEAGTSDLTVSGTTVVAKAGCYAVQIANAGPLAASVEADGASVFSDALCTQTLASGSTSKAPQRTVYLMLLPPSASTDPNVDHVTVTARAGALAVEHRIELRKAAKRLVRSDRATCVQLVDDTMQCVGSTELGLIAGANSESAVLAGPRKTSSLNGAYSALSGRGTTACGILGGAAKCWGVDNWGQLGDGPPTNGVTPVQPTGLANGVVAIEAAGTGTCAAKAGNAYCWGNNSQGQVIDSDEQGFNAPQLRSDLTGGAVIDVGVSDDRSCALFDSGVIKCWRGDPSTIATVDLGAALAMQIGGLYTGMCARTGDAGVFCWANCPYGDCASETPTKVAMPGNVVPSNLEGLATANIGACAWTSEDVYCWGADIDGRTAGSVTSMALSAQRVPLPEGKVEDVAVGTSFWSNGACAIVDGLTYCWGVHLMGALGISTLVGDLLTPISVSLFDDLDADQVFLAAWESRQNAVSAAVHAGSASFWGISDAALGVREGLATVVPKQLTNVSADVSQVDFGAAWAAAIADGKAYTWGTSTDYSLGQGPIEVQTTPTALVFGPGDRALDITAGNVHGCAIVEASSADAGSGTHLYCWGQGAFGQLGDGRPEDPHSAEAPTLVLDETAHVTDVAAGYASTCAVADGRLLCWGGINDAWIPTQISALPSGPDPIVQVEMGDIDAFVRTEAGLVKRVAAGGSSITAITLGKPADNVKAVDLKAAPRHACALGDNGKLYCWGNNASGQLGQGDRKEHEGAQAVQGLVGQVSGFAVGYDLGVTCAKDSEGWKCWGNNSWRAMGLEPFLQATPRLMLAWEN